MKSTISHGLEILESRIAPATLYVLTESGSLLHFDSATPGTTDAALAITGLGAGESLRGIDFRPATSELFAFSVVTGSAANSVIKTYRLDPDTAAATLVGTTAALAGAADLPGGFDFNPTVDRLRIVNTNDENARINPNNGSLAGNDTDLTPAASVDIIGAAYDRNFINVGGATTLFEINRNGSQLAVQGGIDGAPSPNGGVITNIGALGITLSATADGGFDIEAVTGTAYAALTTSANQTGLYTINLTTGAATFVGLIDNGATQIRGLAVAMPEILTIVNDRTANYTDEDGDRVTIKVSKGALAAGDFGIAVYGNGGGQLRFINFSDDGTEFDGANLSITVKKAPGGDGLANVGFIKARDLVAATGVDLGTVTVPGDLGSIDVGDADATDTALAKLSVRSLGRFGIATQANVPDQISDIFGGLGTLDVKSDVFEAQLSATGTGGKISSVKIGGSLIGGQAGGSGSITAQSEIGKVTIGGDLAGGEGSGSGRISSAGAVGSVTIGGSIRGGSGDSAGSIAGVLGTVKVKFDVVGGTGSFSGVIQGIGDSGPITIGGSLRGAAGFVSADIIVAGDLGPVKIGRDLLGGEGDQTGRIFTAGDLASLTIGGSLAGGGGSDSGEITVIGNIGPIKIARDFIGGSVFGADSNFNTGYIQSLDRIASISIGGSIISGIDDSTDTLTTSASIRVAKDLGSLAVKGSILGNSSSGQLTPVIISAVGQTTPGATSDLAIGKITVGGRVERAQILAGYSISLVATNGNASIGAVKVGRDWIASDLVAGIQDNADSALNDPFGDADDQLIPGFAGDALVARIASIAIKGIVIGTGSPTTDRFGFAAEQIGSFSALGFKLPLTSGADTFPLAPLTGDVTLRDF